MAGHERAPVSPPAAGSRNAPPSRRQSRPAFGGVHRPLREHAEPRWSQEAPEDERGRAADRLHRPASGRLSAPNGRVFSADVCGAKAHVVFDPDLGRPVYHSVTAAAKINDITAAKEMPVEPGATYVFDLGYYDYGWWAELDAAGCRIVTRFKTQHAAERREGPAARAGTRVLSDRIGFLPRRQAKKPQESHGRRGARDRRIDGDGQMSALSHQRPRCAGRRDRRSLQAALDDRTVLPADEADAQDTQVHRALAERRARSRSPPHSSPHSICS